MRSGRLRALTSALLLGALLMAGPRCLEAEDAPIWLVVTKSDFVEALKPLASHRQAEGFEARIVTTDVRTALDEAPRRPAFLLIVGDDEKEPSEASWRVPAASRPFYRWRAVQPFTFATDALWGDVDGDLVPDIAVGRIPARTAAEVRTVVQKILVYEAQKPTAADLRLIGWAGAPGYNPLIDRMATGLLVRTVRSRTPPWAEPFLLSADPAHPLAGWPPEQPDVFDAELRRGALLGAIVAHGNATSVLAMRYEGKGVRYDVDRARSRFAEGPPAPPVVILACDCAAFDRAEPSLAETLLLMPAGPVAAIAATTESHPLPNFFSGRSLLTNLAKDEKRLGRMWCNAQREALTGKNFLVERAMKDAEGSLEPEIDVAKLRRDQALLYALLGDPALRLRLPDALDVTVESTEDGWRWTAKRPPGATSLSVGLRPPEAKPAPPPEPPADADEARARFAAANAAWTFLPQPGPAEGEPWTGVVKAPEGARLRLVVTGPDIFCVFAADLERPETSD